MRVEFLCYGALMSNCYAIVSENECFVVDPGADADEISTVLEESKLIPKGILLTHGHFDHAMNITPLSKKYNIPIYVHEKDADMLGSGEKNAYEMCYGKSINLGCADIMLKDNDEIALGNEKIKVLHTPGHSPGSVCFLAGDGLVSGDTIFATSVGRWDLYGGDLEALKLSILRLTRLAPDLTVYSGHGQPSRLGNALERVERILKIN